MKNNYISLLGCLIFTILATTTTPCFASQGSSNSIFSELFSILNEILSNPASYGFSTTTFSDSEAIEGNGDVVTKSYDFTKQPFESIEVMGGGEMKVYVTNKPNTATAAITIDSNLLPYIDISVKGKTLYISSKENIKIKSWTKREIIVNADGLLSLITRGSCNSAVNNIKSDVFSVESTGSGRIELYGNTEYLSIHTLGSSKVDTTTLEAKEADVDCFGSCRILTRATQKLNINISGSGRVEYFGSPEEVNKSIRGSGRIIHT